MRTFACVTLQVLGFLFVTSVWGIGCPVPWWMTTPALLFFAAAYGIAPKKGEGERRRVAFVAASGVLLAMTLGQMTWRLAFDIERYGTAFRADCGSSRPGPNGVACAELSGAVRGAL